MTYIAARCRVLQQEMLQWSNGGLVTEFGGTLSDLIELYQRDEDSPFHAKRADTRRAYTHDLRTLEREVGSYNLADLSGRDFMRMHRIFKEPVTKTLKDGSKVVGPERLRRAHGLMTMLKIVIKYGKVVEIPHCDRLRSLLEDVRFTTSRPRVQRLTAEHAEAIIAKAIELDRPSIALAQAIQFELMLRQKDVIGEWVSISDPGMSDITDRRQKWMIGLRWDEISEDLILSHRTSKTGAELDFDLRQYPMLMQVWPKDRGTGPVIVSETTKMPYRKRYFADEWRRIATAAGVPSDVWNMDSRAGGVSEATDADPSKDNLEAARHHAGHQNIATTQRYSRGSVEKMNKVAKVRAAFRTNSKQDSKR